MMRTNRFLLDRISNAMALILDGNSEHVAHAWSIVEKIWFAHDLIKSLKEIK